MSRADAKSAVTKTVRPQYSLRHERAQTRAPARLPDNFDPTLSHEDSLDLYVRNLFLPWARDGHVTIIACAADDAAMRIAAESVCTTLLRYVVLPKRVIVDALQDRFRDTLAHDAEFALAESRPDLSARAVLTPTQRRVLITAAMAIAAAAACWPQSACDAALIAAALLYLAGAALRVALCFAGWEGKGIRRVSRASLRQCEETGLPTYSVLVPLHEEANMVGAITRALSTLDYPALDIKLALEETDGATIAAARALSLDDRFEILIVPKSHLHTKPRACNYALRFARGEFTVIFDAEDRPERDQLKKAVRAFRSNPEIACLQARLRYYNAARNLLTRGIMAQTPLGRKRAAPIRLLSA